MPIPSAAQVADAISGRFGNIAPRFRFELRDHEYNFLATVPDGALDTDAVTIVVQNDQSVPRTATFGVVDPTLSGIDPNLDLLAVFEEVWVQAAGEWAEIPAGLFALGTPRRTRNVNGIQTWVVDGYDLCYHLSKAKLASSWSSTAGANMLTTAGHLIQQQGMRLSPDWPTSSLTFAVARPYSSAKSWLEVVNAILADANFYPAYVDRVGQFLTRARIDPSTETPQVAYRDDLEPRMIIPPLPESEDRARFTNRVSVAIADPARSPVTIKVENNDPASTISIQSLEGDVVDPGPIAGGGVPDTTTAIAIADFTLREQAARSYSLTLETLPDLRREAREFYLVVFGADYPAPGQLFRVDSWRLSKNGDQMRHTHVLNKVLPVIVTAPFTVSPASLSQTHAVAFNVTVTAANADGSTNTGYTGTVTFSSTDPAATLPGPYTFTTGGGGDNGVHTFSITLATVGIQSVSVYDSATTAEGSSQVITVG